MERGRPHHVQSAAAFRFLLLLSFLLLDYLDVAVHPFILIVAKYDIIGDGTIHDFTNVVVEFLEGRLGDALEVLHCVPCRQDRSVYNFNASCWLKTTGGGCN